MGCRPTAARTLANSRDLCRARAADRRRGDRDSESSLRARSVAGLGLCRRNGPHAVCPCSRRGQPDASGHSRSRDGRHLSDCRVVARAQRGSGTRRPPESRDPRRGSLCRQHGRRRSRRYRGRFLADSVARHPWNHLGRGGAEHRRSRRRAVACPGRLTGTPSALDAATHPASGAGVQDDRRAAPHACRGCRRRFGSRGPGVRSRMDATARTGRRTNDVCLRHHGRVIHYGHCRRIDPRRPPGTAQRQSSSMARGHASGHGHQQRSGRLVHRISSAA